MPNDLTLEQACKRYMADSVAEKPQHVNISDIIAKRNIYGVDRHASPLFKNESNPKNLSNAFRNGGN